MSFLPGAKESDFKTLETDVYESVITGVKRVDNPFYEAEVKEKGADKVPEHKKYQLQWDAKVRGVAGQEEVEGTSLRFFTSAGLSLDSRAKAPKLFALLDPNFDVRVGYETEEGMRSANVGRPVRLSVKPNPVEKNGETKTYNKVTDWMASKAGELSTAENLTLVVGGELSDDIPF